MWNPTPARLRVESLETREVPSANPLWNLALGYNDHGACMVRFMKAEHLIYSFSTGHQLDFNAPQFPCQELRVAVGDVNGDGTADVIAANGPNINSANSHHGNYVDAIVRVFDGASLPDPHDNPGNPPRPPVPIEVTSGLRLIAEITLPWQSGAFLASGDLDGDGYDEVVAGRDIRQTTSTSPKGPNQVAVYSGRSLTNLAPSATPHPIVTFEGIEDPAWWGGTPVAVGDVSGDGTPDVVVGTGTGGAPRVAVWDGAPLGQGSLRKVCGDFFGTDIHFEGINLAVADMDQDGYGDVLAAEADTHITSPRVTDGHSLVTGNPTRRTCYLSSNSPISPPVSPNHVGNRLAVKDFNGDKVPDLAVSYPRVPYVWLYLGLGRFDEFVHEVQELAHLDPFATVLTGTNHGGVWVG
jgi:hypothetical protein